jgi:hypothetical protein
MASAKIDICNQAISHLAVGAEIQDLDNEKTEAAQACRRFYDVARQKVLSDFDWPFAFAIENLTQVATQPTVEWLYSYRYPAKALVIRRLPNGATRTDTQISRAIYSIGRDATGKIIYADVSAPATVEYTYDEDDTTRFPPDFVVALSLYLASLIGPRVAGGDQFKLADRAYQYYRQAIKEAWVNAANQEPRDFDPDPALVNIR